MDLIIADEDPREFNDLIITYFSGFLFENQVRRRHDQYERLLGTREPRWLMLFEGGKMAREGEVVFIDSDHLDFRGHRFELRHSARGQCNS